MVLSSEDQNFGLWILHWDDCKYSDYIGYPIYIQLRKLSRVFNMACYDHGVDTHAFKTPKEFHDHLVQNDAEKQVMLAFETAESVWKEEHKQSNPLKTVYSDWNFDRWP